MDHGVRGLRESRASRPVVRGLGEGGSGAERESGRRHERVSRDRLFPLRTYGSLRKV